MVLPGKPVDEVHRLFALRSYALLDSAPETNFNSVAQLAAKLTGASMSLISLIDSDRQWFKACFGCDLAETSRDQAFCAHAILGHDELFVVPDTHKDPRFADNPLVLGSPRIRFYAGQPLVNPEGMALGTLCVLDPQPRDLSDDQRYTLQVLAASLMTTLELRRSTRIDPVTCLLNRAAFDTALEEALSRLKRTRCPFFLLQLELDGVTELAARDGTEAADQLLRDVGRTLIPLLDETDVAARIESGRFAILTGVRTDTTVLVSRIRCAVTEALVVRGAPVTASIGVVAFSRRRTGPRQAAYGLTDALPPAGWHRVLHRPPG